VASFSDTSFGKDTAFSSSAFDFGGGPTPPPVVTTTVRPSGGFPAYDRGPTKEQTRRSRVAFGIIKDVAKRQAELLRLDEIQRQQELREELRLRGIEAEIAHFRELARLREKLIAEEIALRLRIMLDDEAALAIILASL